MIFLKNEKVFSLSKTSAYIPYGSITDLFSEFYCYLLVAGLFVEGEGFTGLHCVVPKISSKDFFLFSGSYRSGLAQLISKGLQNRFLTLKNHTDLSEVEKDLLESIDGIFSNDGSFFSRLSGKSLFGVAVNRNFSDDMTVIAQYVARTFGQWDYPEPCSVPSIYLSIFGNIHLSRDKMIVLENPILHYGRKNPDGQVVTALWSLISAQLSSFISNPANPYPGDELGETLSGFGFLTECSEFSQEISIPTYAAALYSERVIGIDSSNPVSLSASFYRSFLYGRIDETIISRKVYLDIILDLMMEKMGETHLSHLFKPNSFYRKLSTTSKLTSKIPKKPLILQFALEKLDTEQKNEDDILNEESTSQEDSAEDPQTEDGGYDPSTPAPAVPFGTSDIDKDTIGLISFDKSGEGVDEDLYRAAVVALNDRLRSDDTLTIEAEVKDALDYWVNGFLYRTAIKATKDQIAVLNLQQYLKNISTKG